jgi:hypothetical protein
MRRSVWTDHAGKAPPVDHDLGRILQDWPFEPDRPNVRLVSLEGGRTVLQVRLELGVFQMELEGRPDGARPGGRESLLAWTEERLAAHRAAGGLEEDFVLDPHECAALRGEAAQIYQRTAALAALEEHARVAADCERSLRIFALCQAHGASHADRTVLEQYRPLVITMRTRAQAALALGLGDTAGALGALDMALAEMERHFAATGSLAAYEHSDEVALLRGMRRALVPRLPMGERAELLVRLEAAVAAENFRLAAILRDEIRQLDARGWA